MDRITKAVDGNLVIGDREDVERYNLENRGIDFNLDMSSRSHQKDTEVEYKYISIPDGSLEDTEYSEEQRRKQFFEAVDTVVEKLQDGDTVLVNCDVGVSRSPAVAATALAAVENLQLEEALAIVEGDHPATHPDENLLEHGLTYLENWEGGVS